jgi:hypothetical protein
MATRKMMRKGGGTGGIQKNIAKQTQSMLKTGERFKSFDQIRQRHFWSSYFFTADANGYVPAGRYTLFTTPVGNNGQGFPSGFVLTDRESNWKSQNRVPDNQNFEITELGCQVMSADFAQGSTFPLNEEITATAASNFFQSTILSITYLTNSVPLGLCADYAQASGMDHGVHMYGVPILIEGTPNVVTPPLVPFNSVPVNGFSAPALRRKFKIPILLQHGESFNFTLEIPRPTYIGFGGNTSPTFLLRMDFWATESFVEQS